MNGVSSVCLLRCLCGGIEEIPEIREGKEAKAREGARRRGSHTCRIQTLPLRLQIVKIGRDGGGRAGSGVPIQGCRVAGIDFVAVGDETVVIGLLEPFVDDSAGPDGVHIGTLGG